jgi:hypothetical protein
MLHKNAALNYAEVTKILFLRTQLILLTKTPAKQEECFLIPDVRGNYDAHDAHCCDLKIKLL